MPPNIQFTPVPVEELDLIAPLWRKLREHHAKLPWAYAQQMGETTFEARKGELMTKSKGGHIRIDVVRNGENKSPIAYCISSMSADAVGEIDSMFVEEPHRKSGIGSELVRRSLSWMDAHSAKSKVVVVAECNREAQEFYSRFGFRNRLITMEHKTG